jgi:outer membrane receptor protein involved in Fe transport
LESADPDARLKWVAGFFYQRNTQVSRQFVQDTFLPNLFADVNGVPFAVAFGQGLVGGLYTFNQDPVLAHDKQIAGFGQVDFKLTPKLTLTAGLRWEEATFDAVADYNGPVVGPPVHDTGQKTEHPLTPKFGVAYQATDDNLFYATAAKGFRIGGYNPQIGSPCTPLAAQYGFTPSAGNPTGRPPTFDSDTLWSYEVGSKNRLMRGRGQLNVSAYYIDWTSIQQGLALRCGFAFTANLGKAVSQGFDLDAAFRVNDHLTLGGAVGYNDAKFKETVHLGVAPKNLVTSGDSLPGSPWTVTLNGQYDFEVLDHDAFLRLDYQYHSKGPSNTAGLDPQNLTVVESAILIPTPETNELSARVGVQVAGANVSVFVRNLLDDHPNLGRADLAFAPSTLGGPDTPLYTGQTLRPRAFGMTVTTRY